jgi:hypothetical protein
MTEDKFWAIIEQSRTGHDGTQFSQENALKKILRALTTEEVVAFDRIFTEMLGKAYTWDLWGAAFVIAGGCSDDGFEYFRRGLIAAGRQKFEKALEDPESLAEWAEPDEVEFEGIKYAIYDVYAEKTGTTDLPRHDLTFPEIRGEAWEEESDDLQKRFPKLWAKFSA